MNGIKIISKRFFLIAICISFGLTAQSQNKKMEFSATTGLVINHELLGIEFQGLDYGVHFGFNMYTKQMKRFKTDLQVSLNYSVGNSNFLSVNALYGGRYYFTDPEKLTTFFANALIGGVYINEAGDDFFANEFGFGYSAGCFVGVNRFVIGASVESYNNFIFKLGYTF